ncbi:MAG TPA: hypothetical protein VGR74_03170 [Actinomycetota bacterium]|nr:hypothetical protein [Actinomycetota bacterium]
MGVRGLGWRERLEGGDLVGTPDPGERPRGGGRPAELGENRGVITTTVVSGIVAVAVAAAAEWTGSGRALDTPAGVLWSLVALLGVVAMLFGVGLELHRRRQLAPGVPAAGPAGPAGPGSRRPHAPLRPIGVESDSSAVNSHLGGPAVTPR